MTETTPNTGGDDVELLERVRTGDARACEVLVGRHGGRMLTVAR
jgi:hypothetical protein